MVRGQEFLTGLFLHHEKSIHKCNSLQKSWTYLTGYLSSKPNNKSRYRLEGKTEQAWLESRCSSSVFSFLHSILMKESSKLTDCLTCGAKSLYLQKERSQELKEEILPMFMQLTAPRPEKILALILWTFGPWVGYYCVLQKAWPRTIFALLK